MFRVDWAYVFDLRCWDVRWETNRHLNDLGRSASLYGAVDARF